MVSVCHRLPTATYSATDINLSGVTISIVWRCDCLYIGSIGTLSNGAFAKFTATDAGTLFLLLEASPLTLHLQVNQQHLIIGAQTDQP